MTKRSLMIATASAAFMLVSAAIGAEAAQVSVGGVSVSVGNSGNGGTKAGASTGNTAASATIGGGGGNVATATASSGNDKAKVTIGTGNGPLATANQNGTPLGSGSTTKGAINLGGLLGVITGPGGNGGGGGGGGGGSITPTKVDAALGGMSKGEQIQLRKTCRGVLSMPSAYDSDIVKLCTVLRSL